MIVDTPPDLDDLPDIYEGTIEEIADTGSALEWVNEVRVEHGVKPLAELPQGQQRGDLCPIALALKDVYPHVWVSPFYLEQINQRDGVGIITYQERLPMHVSMFIKRFDAGLYPELRLESPF